MKKRNLVLFGTTAMLSLALAGTIGAVTASAADIKHNDQSKNTTTVTYTATDEWTVTIPDSINVASPSVENDKVSASGVKIADGTTLTVTVASGNEWHLRKAEQQEGGIAYKLKAGGSDLVANKVLEVAAGTATGEAALTVELQNADNLSTGGEAYTDTLTFTVAVA